MHRFTKFAEESVLVDLDSTSFEIWYKTLLQKHRRVPRDKRKEDGDFCEYLNILFHSQPTWRESYELRMQANAAARGNLDAVLEIIRDMLQMRSTYAKLDAEQGGSPAASAALGLAAQQQAKVATTTTTSSSKSGTGEANSVKPAFATLMASGDTAAAYAVASNAGMTRSNFDPKKTGPAAAAGDFTPFPRTARQRRHL